MIRVVSRLRSTVLDRGSTAPSLLSFVLRLFWPRFSTTFFPIFFPSIHIFLLSFFSLSLPLPPPYPQLMSSDSFFYLSSFSSSTPFPPFFKSVAQVCVVAPPFFTSLSFPPQLLASLTLPSSFFFIVVFYFLVLYIFFPVRLSPWTYAFLLFLFSQTL